MAVITAGKNKTFGEVMEEIRSKGRKGNARFFLGVGAGIALTLAVLSIAQLFI